MVFNLARTIEAIAEVRYTNIKNKLELWVELYLTMEVSNDEAKNIKMFIVHWK